MALANRKITVVVDGSSAELRDAISQAVSSLKELGSVVSDVSTKSKTATDGIVKANTSAAESYARLATAAKEAAVVVGDAAIEMDDAAKMQADAFGRISKVASSVGAKVTKSMDAAAISTTVAATDITTASTEITTSLADVGAAAVTTADDVVASATKQSDAYTAVAAEARDSAKLQMEAQARVAEGSKVAADAAVAGSGKQGAAARAAADTTAVANGRASTAVADGSKRQAAGWASNGSQLVKFGKLVTETAAVVAVGSLYMSGKFEAATTRLLTQAGATESQLKQMRTGILNMASSVGASPQVFAESLYHVTSSMNAVLPVATRTNEELKITKIALEGAAIGGSNSVETTYALASAMNALHLRASDAQHTMAVLNAIVGSGDMTMEDLVQSLKSGLIPTAQTFGVSLQSVGSALAVMGDQGMRGALAGTRLRMALSLIAGPSEKSQKVLAALGMSAGEIHAKTTAMSEALEKAGLGTTTMAKDLQRPDGIMVALRDLHTHLVKAGLSSTEIADVFARAFGGGRMSASIELLAQSTGRVGAKYDQISRQSLKFNEDLRKTHETLKFQAKEALSALESLGIVIGHDLEPVAKSLLHDLTATAEWLGHNKTAAEALAAVITGVLGVAVAAFVANRLGKMVRGLREAGELAGKVFGVGGGGSSAASRVASGVAPSAGPTLASAEMGIWGARGRYMPGSLTNPIIVAIEAGQFAGMGSRGAAIGATPGTAAENISSKSEPALAGRGAAQADLAASGAVATETMTAERSIEATAKAEATRLQSGVISGGVRTAPTLAGGAATAGQTALLASSAEKSSIMSKIGGIAQGVMRGGAIALGGLFASEIAKSMIGGDKGKEIGSAINTTALGAAVGTAIEPGLGTAIGGGLGAIAAGVKMLQPQSKATTEGERLAHPKGGPDLGAIAAKEFAKLKKEEEDAIRKYASLPTSTESPSGHTEKLLKKRYEEEHPNLAAERRKIEGQFAPRQGAALGARESEYVLHGKQNEQTGKFEPAKVFPSLGSIVRTAAVELRSLPPLGQKAYAETIKKMVETLEHEERLPKGALEHLVHDLGPILNKIPGLGGSASKNLTRELTTNLNLGSLQQKIEGSTKAIQNVWAVQFHLLPVTSEMSLTEVISNTESNLKELEYRMTHGTKYMRERAENEYKLLKPHFDAYTKEAAHAAEVPLTELGSKVGPITDKSKKAIIAVFSKLPAGMKEQMEHAGGAVEKGMDKLNRMLYDELKAMGVSLPPGLKTSTLTAVSSEGEGAEHKPESQATRTGHAKGGLVQFGRRGASGRDNIPVDMGDRKIIVGSGEVGAVFTKHQQQYLNQRLSDVGGLPGVFSRVNTPHYMATGGLVPYAAGGPVGTGGNAPAAYSLPLPRQYLGAGTVDQGVDYAAPANTPEYAMGPGKIVGAGIQGFGPNAPILQIDPGPPPLGGRTVYYGHAGPNRVGKGRHVSAGTPITEIGAGIVGKSTGPHLEIGFYPPGGPSSGRAMLSVIQALLGGHTVPPGAGGGGSAAGATASAVNVKHLHAPNLGLHGLIGALAQGILNKVAQGANRKLDKAATAATTATGAATGGHAAGTTQMRAWAKAGLIAAGLPGSANEVSTIVYTMSHESSGNPRSENTTDSNARAGHPSRGLMELIPENFAKYHVPGTANNVFDPVANVAAAVRYMIATYGHIVGKSPYAQGGFVTASTYGGPADHTSYKHTTADNRHVADMNMWGFAELDMGHALGTLPMESLVDVSVGGKTIAVPKVDIGGGGAGVGGKKRAIDLSYRAGRALLPSFPAASPDYIGGLKNVSWKRHPVSGTTDAGGHGSGVSGHAEEGLMLGLGGVEHAAKGITTGKVPQGTSRAAEEAKRKIEHPATRKTHIKTAPRSRLAEKLGDLRYIPGLEDIPVRLAPFAKKLSSLANLSSLLRSMETGHAGPQILESDMKYFPVMAEHGVHPGMTTEDAYRVYERYVAANAPDKNIELEGQFIKWAEGQANHRLLTPQQASTVSAAAKSAGFLGGGKNWAGQPLLQAQEFISEWEVGELGEEAHTARGALGEIKKGLDEYKRREHRLLKLRAVEERRSEHLKGDINRVNKSTLKEKLAAALDSRYQSERIFDAELHRDSVEENLHDLEATPSKERTRADEKEIEYLKKKSAGLKTFMTEVKNPIKGKTEAIQRAELAVLKNHLQEELKPITESLSDLNGNKPMVSIKTVLGDIQKIQKDKETDEGELATITDTSIPTARISLESIRESMQESEIPHITGPATTSNAAAEALQREIIEQQGAELNLERVQTAVLKNFELNLPHFDQGGPVLNDGLAYVHKGEYVVPQHGAAVASGGAPPAVAVHVNHEIRGDIAPLIELIDSRVSHPENVQLISRQQGRRIQGFPGFR